MWVATDPKCVPALKLMSPFLGGSRRPQLMPELGNKQLKQLKLICVQV